MKLSWKPDVTNLLRVVATMFVFVLHSRAYVDGVQLVYNHPLIWITFLPAWAGVWIFMFLSGFGVGRGFSTGKYGLTAKGFGKFYLGRFLKIAPLYYVYCIVFELFSGGYFWKNPIIFLKMVTFTFDGSGGATGMGHLWYVSMAMQAYLIMPLVYLLLRKIKRPKTLTAMFFCVAALGLFLRLLTLWLKLDWYKYVYNVTPMNLDFVICGMILADLKEKKAWNISENLAVKIIAAASFCALAVGNCILYYNNKTPVCMTVYQYILPTAYILVCAFLILAFEETCGRREKLGIKDYLRRPTRLVDWFSGYTYGFYVFHICVFVYAKQVLRSFGWYLALGLFEQLAIFLAISFTVTLLFSTIFSKIITSKHK